MLMNKKSIFVVVFTAGLYMHCSVKVPELNVTGEKTALENQVLGTYQQIESDSWVIASTRSVEGNQDVGNRDTGFSSGNCSGQHFFFE